MIYLHTLAKVNFNFMNLQERNDSYRRTMSVGVGPLGRVRLHISLAMQQAIFWLLSGCLAVVETVSLRII